MADEIEFVSGLIVKAPHERAPDFVKASISIKIQDLMHWLNEQPGEWVNVDVKEAKSGKWYASVSNFKPKNGKPEPQRQASAHTDFEDDIPFN